MFILGLTGAAFILLLYPAAPRRRDPAVAELHPGARRPRTRCVWTTSTSRRTEPGPRSPRRTRAALVLGCARPEPPLEVIYWYLRDW